MEKLLQTIKKIIPRKVFSFFQPAYHYFLAILSAVTYRFPSRETKIIAVTGTKGKSSTTEILNAILEEAGYKTALSNTIRFKIGGQSVDNLYKMSMPGRFFVQRFIRKAADAKCDFVIMEITSQGVLNYRHKFIQLDGLIFTNLSPEHIESHGSYENYRAAKLEIARALSQSPKRPRIIAANGDDKEASAFLAFPAEIKKTFNRNDAVTTPLLGEFNAYNVAGAASMARALGVKEESIRKAVGNFREVPGRVEFVDAGQDFKVVVDYAHTPDSLEKLYRVFSTSRKVCVLGGTGGGRDTWKRKEMGRIADAHCDEIILTNEDPYDEDPLKIVADVAEGISEKMRNKKAKVIMDRREVIREALRQAKTGDVVLITGKGTDPYIMGPNGEKIPWNDARIAKEELEKLMK